ncbi:amino acid adenylation domain-containing protein, partial [Rhodococcus ruber]
MNPRGIDGIDGADPTSAGTAQDPFPLSPAQLGIWYAQLRTPNVAINNAQYVDLRGDLDADVLERVSRVAAGELRSGFVRLLEIDGVPHQVIDPSLPTPLERIDVRDEPDPEAAALAWMRADYSAPIDMLSDRLIVAAAIRLDDSRYFWYSRVHHVVLDGFGAMNFMNRVAELYTAAVGGFDPRPLAAGDLEALREFELSYRDSPRFRRDREYWAGKVADVEDISSLSPRTAPPSPVKAVASATVTSALSERLDAAAERHGTVVSTLLIAAFGSYLAQVTDRDDVVLSLPVTARATAVARRSGGMMSNIVPLRLQIGADLRVGDLVRQVQLAVSGALRHQLYRHEDIRRDSADPSGGLFGPLVNVMLFQSGIRFGPIPGSRHILSTGTVEDLGVNVYPNAENTGLNIDFEANPGRYTDEENATHHARFLDHLARFVECEPADLVRGCPVLSEDEWTRVVREFNRTDHPQPDTTLVSLFEARVARTPDAPAAVFDGRDLTYGQFAARVNRLARRLVAAGVGPETLVAVAVPRSMDMLVAVYAVLTAGGGYVPIDATQPAERVRYILDIADPVVVVAAGDTDLPEQSRRPVVRLDESAPEFPDTPLSDLDRRAPLHPSHTAYVLFTSGSTGRPKGVSVNHAAVVNQVLWVADRFAVDSTDVILWKTPPAFDVSVWEMFTPMTVGARMVIAAPDGHRDPGYLTDLIDEHSVTMLSFVPSMLEPFVDAASASAQQCRSVRALLVAGEALPRSSADQVARALPHAELHNLYGPTEATVHVTDTLVRPHEPVTIGTVLWNCRAYVLDRHLRPLPVGSAGELYLAGAQLARGYHGRADLTAERFVADPFASGERMYRTGDLVRWTPAGELDYIGRVDFQVKLRGQRIELGEIETDLRAVDGIAQAVVLVHENESGQHLVAYVVPRAGATIDPHAVRDRLGRRLPGYMVPDMIMVLAHLPLNHSGKLDRRALPEPVFEARQFRAPSTPVEEVVASVFADVLGLALVGADDDFFAVGGNSLTATQVVARLSAALGTRIPVRSVFEASTVSGLAALIESSGRSSLPRPVLEPRERPAEIPLALAQQRIWFLNQFDPEAPTYNLPFVLRLQGETDVAALEAALRDVVGRHESLRTIFPESETGAHQVILPMSDVALSLPVEPVPAEELKTILAAFASGGFDVSKEIPIRARLFRLDDDDFALAMVIHHIATDGVSFGPLSRDLATAYVARRNGVAPTWPELAVQYADYALWQREVLGDEQDPQSLAAEEISYWTQQLADIPEQLDLPTDRRRPPVQSYVGHRIDFAIGADTHRALAALAREHHVSLFMVVHSALAVLLARLSATEDIVVGTPIAGRGEEALDDLIGMFVNTLALRTQVSSSETFADLLAQVREVDLAAFGNADVPFERLVDVLKPVRAQSRHPIFQVVLAFQNTGDTALELPGLTVDASEVEVDAAKFDLQLTLSEKTEATGAPKGIDAQFVYAADLFDADTVRGFATRFLRILDAVVADAGQAVGDIDLLGPDERAALPARTGTGPVEASTLPDLLARAVAANPDGDAVVYEGRSLTYRSLDAVSSQLARMLVRMGAGPETTVAIAVPRSLDSVVAWWAVAKTGAAFVPVDPTYPLDRIEHMVTDSKAVLGLTTEQHLALLPGSVEWLAVDETEFLADRAVASPAPLTDADRLRPLRLDHVAYVIYTSGSTGVPKGVSVTHAGLGGFAAEMRERFDVTDRSRTLHFASPSFDASVLELLLAIGSAATMVVAPTSVYGGADLARILAEERVTHAFVTPAALGSVDQSGLPELRVVAVGGEAPSPDLVSRWARDRAMFNAYGPTEATVASNISEPLVPGGTVSIGGPIRAVTTYVLDGRFHPVPEGVTGELYIAGPNLARGYHARPGLTADRFVANPYRSGERMYRTGDLVRWVRGAHPPRLEYLGRSDFQVKIRGFRIELGEIDATLGSHPDVEFAVTMGRTGPSGTTQLVSYVHPTPDKTLDSAELTAFVARRLPSHMVPAAIVVLDEVPLTPQGKLDRKALPAPAAETKVFRAPSTPVEEIVANIFGDLLGVARVGADDDFFELGGNSLIATQVVSRLGAALGTTVPVRAVFEASTVKALAARAEHLQGGESRKPLVPAERPERIPLSLAQQRMWFLNRFDTSSAVNNIPVAIRLSGELDITALQVAVIDVTERHESLRTVFPESEDGPYQQVLDAVQTVPDLTPEPVRPEELEHKLLELASVGFDVTSEVPLHAKLFEIGEQEYVLGIVVHHISADGWSMGPLARDVMVAYAARSSWEAPAWPALPVQYADFALWQRDVLGSEDDPDSLISRQLDFWTATLAGLPDQIDLPSDRPRPSTASSVGGIVRFRIEPDLHDALNAVARERGTTLFMVVHAALAVLLSKLSASDDIAIGTPVAGRGEAGLDDLIGMFVNTLVLRTPIEPDETFAALLGRVREIDLGAFGHAEIPFERLVEVLNPARSQARHPLFQVMLAFQNLARTTLELPGLSISAMDFDARVAKFDLQFTLTESIDELGAPAGMAAELSYATDLFDESTVVSVAERFVRVLGAVAADP